MKKNSLLALICILSLLLLLTGSSCSLFNKAEKTVTLTLTSSEAAPGTVIYFTTDSALKSGENYNLYFGETAAPLMAAGTANSYSSSVPVVAAADYQIVIKRGSKSVSHPTTFTVKVLPQTGMAAGAVTQEVLMDNDDALEAMVNDFLPTLQFTGQLGVTSTELIRDKMTQIADYNNTLHQMMLSLDPADKTLLDQLMLTSGIYEVTKAFKTQSLDSKARLEASKDLYLGHEASMALDGFSAVLTALSRLWGMAGAVGVTSTGGATAPIFVLGSVMLNAIDNLIDGYIPTDLTQLSVAGNQPISVPEGGSTSIRIIGRFTTQSSPLSVTLSQSITSILAIIGIPDWASFILSTVTSAGLDVAAPLSVATQNWQAVEYVEHPINSIWYTDGSQGFFNLLATAMDYYVPNPSYMQFINSIVATNYSTANTSIATFNTVGNTLYGHTLGTTSFVYGGYRFVKQSGWASLLGFEYPSSLTGSAVQSCNIQVQASQPNTIQIYSSPAGAQIYLNGGQTGLITPALLPIPYNGTHTIRLAKTGYNDYVQSITTEQGGIYTINAELTATGYPRPRVTITSPEHNDSFNDNVVNVTGTVQLEDAFGTLFPYSGSGATINVNGAESSVYVSEGYFYHTISITSGNNNVFVKCTADNGVSGQSPTITLIGDFAMPDIEAVLTWNTPTSDMDLHVWNPNGEHCYYSNMNTSDGSLDIDDVEGIGPETYTCLNAMQGTYVIKVNSYSLDEDPYTDASMRVWANGAESFFGPHRFLIADYNGNNPDAWWDVVTITIQGSRVLYNQGIPAWMQSKMLRDMANLPAK